jgi:hypothetical protein
MSARTGPETLDLKVKPTGMERGPLDSARSEEIIMSARTVEEPATFRSTMTTSRAHSAIAALAAQRQALEGRLAIVEAALENEGKRQFFKPRGTGSTGKMGKSTKSKRK